MSSKQIHSIVWQTLNRYERRRLFGIWVLILIEMVLETISLGLIIPMVGLLTQDDYVSKIPFGDSLLADLSQRQVLSISMLFVVLVYVIKSSFVYASALYKRRYLNLVSVRVSQETFAKYLRQPWEFHLERNSAALITNVENAKSIITGGLEPILVLLTDGLVATGLFALLMYVQPIGTLCVATLFATSTILFRVVTKERIERWGAARKFHLRKVYQHLQQGLGGAKEIKVLGREQLFLRDHEHHLRLNLDVDQRFNMVQLLPRLWLEMLTMVGLATLVWIMVGTGSSISLILPTLGIFAATAFRVMPSINRILSSIQTIGYSRAFAAEVYSDLQLIGEPEDRSGLNGEYKNAIELVEVSFSYKGAPTNALNAVSFRVAQGEAVGIIGTSGAGKSTLVDVLLGLLVPTSGKVCVDGKDIADHRRWWQDQVGYVPQSIYLTDDTLLNNVAFGLPAKDVDRDAVVRAVTAAQLDEFVHSLPDGLDTVVGERGVRLSGGQRQRIGIARALYHEPSVLVLDEATSALDSETEFDVMEAVQGLFGRKTVIIVAHRTTTVKHCNRILRFEDGRLVAEGTPAELLV